MQHTTTEKLMGILKNASNFEDFLQHTQTKQVEFSQMEYFDYLFDVKQVTKSQVIKSSLLDTYYAYQVFRGAKTPSRDKLLLLAFAFPLDVKETQLLLYICHSEKLYVKNKRDSIILFALEKSCSLEKTNDLLTEENVQALI